MDQKARGLSFIGIGIVLVAAGLVLSQFVGGAHQNSPIAPSPSTAATTAPFDNTTTSQLFA